MCDTCGCSDGSARITEIPAHHHGDHHHSDHDRPERGRTVAIEQRVLAHNDDLAAANRARLAGRGIVAVNVMSSPGSGKTTLLEQTIRRLGGEVPVSVIEGDQETSLDAHRLSAAGARTVQINTGAGCHLDATMVAGALDRLDPPAGSLLLIENVGNLVCPALFDLGETARAVVMSVPEGADKPLKYPHMFRGADVLLLNKVDLLPYVDFDVGACTAAARRLSPDVRVLPVSGTRGDGLTDWFDWLRAGLPAAAEEGAR